MRTDDDEWRWGAWQKKSIYCVCLSLFIRQNDDRLDQFETKENQHDTLIRFTLLFVLLRDTDLFKLQPIKMY